MPENDESDWGWLASHVLDDLQMVDITKMDKVTVVIERIRHIHDLLALFGDGEHNEDLYWRADGEQHLTFYVACSDLFAWATADAQEITLPDDLQGLTSARDDSNVHLFWPLLWVSRKRNLRPMRSFYEHCLKDFEDEKMIELFDAVGPERDVASEG